MDDPKILRHVAWVSLVRLRQLAEVVVNDQERIARLERRADR